MSITKKQFLKLKRGDIILFGKQRTPRIIEEGPANWVPASKCVRFCIRHRSWTNRAYTVYSFTDVKNICSLPRGEIDRDTVRREHYQRLQDSGFNVARELRREVTSFKKSLNVSRRWGVRFRCSSGQRWPRVEDK